MSNMTPEELLNPEALALYRRLNGLDLPPKERAEYFFEAFCDGTVLGPGNRRGLIDALARYFADQSPDKVRADQRLEDIDVIRRLLYSSADGRELNDRHFYRNSALHDAMDVLEQEATAIEQEPGDGT